MKERKTPSDILLKNSHTTRVRFNECDPLGIVWHGHYIVYFEDGREAFGREHGLTYLDVQRNGFATPIVKTTTEHFLPLKYGEIVRIETTFMNGNSAKMIFCYELFNEANQRVCAGETTQVFIDQNGDLQLYNPPFFADWKSKMKLN